MGYNFIFLSKCCFVLFLHVYFNKRAKLSKISFFISLTLNFAIFTRHWQGAFRPCVDVPLIRIIQCYTFKQNVNKYVINTCLSPTYRDIIGR